MTDRKDIETREDIEILVDSFYKKVLKDETIGYIFKDVAKANPSRHEPYVLALKTAKKLNETESIQWATCGILSQEWPMKHRHIREEALISARAQMIKMARAKQTTELELGE